MMFSVFCHEFQLTNNTFQHHPGFAACAIAFIDGSDPGRSENMRLLARFVHIVVVTYLSMMRHSLFTINGATDQIV
jgi:hypothetical protein